MISIRCQASAKGILFALATASLADQMRTAVQLVYFQGLKYREAAEVLDIPVGTVRSRLSRARQALRREVDG